MSGPSASGFPSRRTTPVTVVRMLVADATIVLTVTGPLAPDGVPLVMREVELAAGACHGNSLLLPAQGALGDLDLFGCRRARCSNDRGEPDGGAARRPQMVGVRRILRRRRYGRRAPPSPAWPSASLREQRPRAAQAMLFDPRCSGMPNAAAVVADNLPADGCIAASILRSSVTLGVDAEA
jgi:hypothetical protein